MRFLVDANVPLSVAPRIRALGHEATDVREIAMGNADDGVIARHARENAFCLITRDRALDNVALQ
jgi:predicted nuclease of predicted toxin-antitoxin system